MFTAGFLIQAEEANKAFCIQLEVPSPFYALIIMGDLADPDSCWKGTNSPGYSCTAFSTQMLEDPKRGGALLDLVLMNKGVVGNMKVGQPWLQ